MTTISRVLFLLLLILPRYAFSEPVDSTKTSAWSHEEISKTTAVLQSSMKEKNGVPLTRLVQDEMQLACSNQHDRPRSEQQATTLRSAAMNSVIYPVADDYLGDWREGEKIAQNGKGMQYSDDPETPNGGNCYACHQLDPAVTAAGNI